MLVLGLHGSGNPISENISKTPFPEDHDAAAVIIRDGQVVAAVEEERLNRFKHCHCRPREAIRACLSLAKASIGDIDRIALPIPEQAFDFGQRRAYWLNSHNASPVTLADTRTIISGLINVALGVDLDWRDRLYFTGHHEAHAASAYFCSGFDRGLVVTIDGEGQTNAGLILSAEGKAFRHLGEIDKPASLGWFYVELIRYLGYWFFDEYKVMGLAPYGDPARYRELFRSLYDLQGDGQFVIHRERMLDPFSSGAFQPRKRGEPVLQEHKDFAAGLQAALEHITMHLLEHYQKATGHRNLCLAGGVAHNCTMNGKIARSGLFDQVFVQPAAHDSGLALGAAFEAYYDAHPERELGPRISHVFWGTDVGSSEEIATALSRWEDFVEVTQHDDIPEVAARLLASGEVLGWVQGRSEFGPRALGNRSIIADPRPAENRDRINSMIKKREGYRPFAPSVLLEEADRFFDIPHALEDAPFMLFVCDVRPEMQSLLGAVTHVDGTARVQTVDQKANPKYWQLIRAFARHTGVPVVLNTSFNNNVEPIVDSVDDALACYLTTQLNRLVVGDFLVSRKDVSSERYLSLTPHVPEYYHLTQTVRVDEDGGRMTHHRLANAYAPERDIPVSPVLFQLLTAPDAKLTCAERMDELSLSSHDRAAVMAELLRVWSERGLFLRPV